MVNTEEIIQELKKTFSAKVITSLSGELGLALYIYIYILILDQESENLLELTEVIVSFIRQLLHYDPSYVRGKSNTDSNHHPYHL